MLVIVILLLQLRTALLQANQPQLQHRVTLCWHQQQLLLLFLLQSGLPPAPRQALCLPPAPGRQTDAQAGPHCGRVLHRAVNPQQL